ncbi:MAG: isochorismatase family protein [Saprospiraceae bacterium]|nr:isochorismatase family protein [Saprospiraceae bacterium]
MKSQNNLAFSGRYLKQSGKEFKERQKKLNWNPAETAIIVCDMWDQHWCKTATLRVTAMAPRMNLVLTEARKSGITIVHAPSSTMKFYADIPQRKKMMEMEDASSSAQIKDWYYLDPTKEPALPIDDSDGGCDDPDSDCVNCEVWKKQIDILDIGPKDCISDSGKEINNYFVKHNIKNVILMGVHTNMCVLGRPFGIRSHLAQGRSVVLVRDLTDSMYNPVMPPIVSHDDGTQLVINHIEKYWCSTITSDQLINNTENK